MKNADYPLMNRVIDAIDADTDWLGCGGKARASLTTVVTWLREQAAATDGAEAIWLTTVAERLNAEIG
jgi:hypothetical protein